MIDLLAVGDPGSRYTPFLCLWRMRVMRVKVQSVCMGEVLIDRAKRIVKNKQRNIKKPTDPYCHNRLPTLVQTTRAQGGAKWLVHNCQTAQPNALLRPLFDWCISWSFVRSSTDANVRNRPHHRNRVIERSLAVAFSTLARVLGECSTIHSPPALFFFKVEFS